MSTSFWLDRTGKSEKQTFDVVIVGAGITGLSTAYWLEKEDPSLKVAIVEKSRVAFGASGRNAGFVTCGSVEHFNRMINKHGMDQAVEIWKFSETNLKLIQEEIVQGDRHSIQFENDGAFSLAAQDNEFAELKKVSEIMTGLKIPTEIVDGDGVAKRLGAKGFVGGIKYLGDSSTNPVALLERMRSKIKAPIFEGVEAYKIDTLPDGTKVLKTDRGDFECSMVALALNGYAANLHPYFKDKIFPTRGQCLMTEAVPRFMEGPCYANFYLDYFRQTPTGELLIGGFRQIEKETEVGYSDHLTDVIQNSLHDFVVTHLPKLASAKVTHRWGGVMGFAKDGEPLVGSIPDDPSIFFAGGYTGHGIGLAFNTAKTLVDLIFGREIPNWISARRFQ
ncbi:MAG: FAD-binding oxidoreductase [Bdellovibrionales bacterium]|nr:FAD-binding oxidoreductase [Bdellovibrionales bacterium]